MKAAKQRSAWAHCVAYGGVPRLTGGHDQNIRQLKSFLRESPRPGRRHVDDSDADQSPADEAASDPESEPGPEPLVPAVEDEPSSESRASAGPSSPEAEEEGVENASPSESSQGDSLTARTLRLGECSSGSESCVSESSDHRDSQVKDSWMGKAMSQITRQTMAAEAWERKLENLILDIKFDLQEQLHAVMEGSEWDQYSEWCKGILTAHGDSVYSKLADAGHFKRWIFRQKSEPAEEKGLWSGDEMIGISWG